MGCAANMQERHTQTEKAKGIRKAFAVGANHVLLHRDEAAAREQGARAQEDGEGR